MQSKSSGSQGGWKLGLGSWLDSGNPVKAGLAVMTLLSLGAAAAFFGVLIITAFKERRLLQL
jgi:hypothetical protein